jgi:hypothetical protein
MVAPLVGIALVAAARGVASKVASNAVKSAATKKLVAQAAKKKKLAEPSKASVKVKPAARQKPNPPDISKIVDRQQRRSFGAEGEEMPSRLELVQMRKLITGQRPATQPKGFGSGASRVKINSNPVRANRTRSGKKTK